MRTVSQFAVAATGSIGRAAAVHRDAELLAELVQILHDYGPYIVLLAVVLLLLIRGEFELHFRSRQRRRTPRDRRP